MACTRRAASWEASIRRLPTLGANVSISWNTCLQGSDSGEFWNIGRAASSFKRGATDISLAFWGLLGSLMLTSGTSGLFLDWGISGSSSCLEGSGMMASGVSGEGLASKSIICFVFNRLFGLIMKRLRLAGGASSCSPTKVSSHVVWTIHLATCFANPEQYVAQNRVKGMCWPSTETLPSIGWWACWCLHRAWPRRLTSSVFVENTWLDFRRKNLVTGCLSPNWHMSKLARCVRLKMAWNCSIFGIVDPFGCSRWKLRLRWTWNLQSWAHKSTWTSSRFRQALIRSNKATLLHMFSLLHPPQGPHSGATQIFKGWYLSMICHNFLRPSTVARSPSWRVKRMAKCPDWRRASVSGLQLSAYTSSSTHCFWGALHVGDTNASSMIRLARWKDFCKSSLTSFGDGFSPRNFFVLNTSSWYMKELVFTFESDPRWHEGPGPTALGKTSRNLADLGANFGIWLETIGNTRDRTEGPEHMCCPCASFPMWFGTDPILRLSSGVTCWDLGNRGHWQLSLLMDSHPNDDLRHRGSPPPPRSRPAPANWTPWSWGWHCLQERLLRLGVEELGSLFEMSPANCLGLSALTEAVLVESLALVNWRLRLLLWYHRKFGLGVVGLLMTTWGSAEDFSDCAVLEPCFPLFASLPVDPLGLPAALPVDVSKTAAASWEDRSRLLPPSSTNSSWAQAAWVSAQFGLTGSGGGKSFETGLAMVREMFSTWFSPSCIPCVGSLPLDRTPQTWWLCAFFLKKLMFEAHSWRTSNKYNSVGFSSSWIERFNLWR